ncbi:MAG TPA: hypothetical protein VK927_07925 [Adhaeribacter sp.]|nr:hypothetical protein [Adhaeribacter sp.]
MSFLYTRANILRGLLIYSLGDTAAALLQDNFSVLRLLGMMLIGATVYAFEIPNFFRYIDKKLAGPANRLNSVKRTALSMLYFSPLWVARHLLFIKIFSGQVSEISWDLLRISVVSFAYNIPVAFAANYLIQNKLPFHWRFMGSGIFSALMAVYYALAANWFR